MLNKFMLSMPPSEQLKGVEFRAAINMTFAAVGRGGEVAKSSFQLAHWNTVYNSLFLDWQESKTNAQKPMNFFPDAQYYEIDVYHSLACYFVMGAGSGRCHSTQLAQHWIFPFLADGTAKSASTKITNYLRKLAPFTENQVPADVTTGALRVGGSQTIVNRTGDIVLGTVRGGWGGYLASVATIMEYYQQTHETLSRAGRALAGWPDPRKHVEPPGCSCILACMNAEQRTAFDTFLSVLFDTAHFRIMGSGLRGLAYCMFGSLVQYLPQFTQEYGDDHMVVVKLVADASRCGYPKAVLLSWGAAVAADWALQNAPTVAVGGDMEPLIVALQRELTIVRDSNSALLQKVGVLEKGQDAVLAKLCQLERTMSQTVSRQLPEPVSPARKRRGTSLSPLPGQAPMLPSSAPGAPVPTSLPFPPPTTTAAPTKPALPALSLRLPQAPQRMFQFNNSTTPLHLFKTWFINGLTKAQVGLKWTATDPKCISRVNKVMANALMVLKEQPALRSVLHPAGVRPVPPPIASAEYATWAHDVYAACDELTNAVHAAIHARWPGKFTTDAVSVNALNNKLEALAAAGK
jgi:hypothetical protein